MNFPVFDLHADTSNELIGKGYHETTGLFENKAHIDLKRASSLKGYAQCFACFTTSNMDEDSVTLFNKKKNAVLKQVNKNSHLIKQVFSAKDIEENYKNGLMSAILTMEGACGIDCDPERLEDLKKQGFLIGSLCWNEKNSLTGSCVTGEGLSNKGKVFIKEAQRVGMLIDVSHLSDQGFWDIMDITQAPVIATHSNSRSVFSKNEFANRRNITDEMFKAIVQTGGVVGINLCPDFLGVNVTLNTVCDHVLRFLELDPTGKHISLGGDLDGIDDLPQGFHGVEDYPKLAQVMISRGISKETVEDIFWNNANSLLKRVEK